MPVFRTVLFLYRILLVQFDNFFFRALFQLLHIFIHLFASYFGIDLCGGNTFMPHHAADCFNGYAHGERDMRAEIMPGLVETEKRYEQWKREESVT